jgi:hypothetical protein
MRSHLGHEVPLNAFVHSKPVHCACDVATNVGICAPRQLDQRIQGFGLLLRKAPQFQAQRKEMDRAQHGFAARGGLTMNATLLLSLMESEYSAAAASRCISL